MFQRYYRILNINQNAGPEEVKRAYRKIAKACHPDVNPDPKATQLFIDATLAYDRIIDRLKRPSHYKYTQTKTTYRKERKRKSGYKEHPADRGRRYSKMKYKKYQQQSTAYTDTHNFWMYRIYYYAMQLFIYTLILTISILTIMATITSGNVFLLTILAATIYVATKSNKFFLNWKKDFKNIFKDQD